jgi:protein PhnA
MSLNFEKTARINMSNEPKCPECSSANSYHDGNLWVCPDCNFEWDQTKTSDASEAEEETNIVRDAHGNILNNGDSVTVLKELKVKGSSSGIKAGTKVKGIRIIESDNGHNISCKIDGIGSMYLKSEFVRKA